MRKVTCALVAALTVIAVVVGTHVAQATEPSSADRSKAMFNLIGATSAAVEAQRVFSSTPDFSRISPEKREELVSQGGKLLKLARKLIKGAKGYKPTSADPQYEATRSLAIRVYRQALEAYRKARAAV